MSILLPRCPKCNSELAYEDGAMLICPDRGHKEISGIEFHEKAKFAIRELRMSSMTPVLAGRTGDSTPSRGRP